MRYTCALFLTAVEERPSDSPIACYCWLVSTKKPLPAMSITLVCTRWVQVVVPNMACRVIDRAIQMHGGMGVCQDTFLSEAYAHMRTLRIADGPDEVHTRSVAKYEYRRSTGNVIASRL